jgi:hypothetical protein
MRRGVTRTPAPGTSRALSPLNTCGGCSTPAASPPPSWSTTKTRDCLCRCMWPWGTPAWGPSTNAVTLLLHLTRVLDRQVGVQQRDRAEAAVDGTDGPLSRQRLDMEMGMGVHSGLKEEGGLVLELVVALLAWRWEWSREVLPLKVRSMRRGAGIPPRMKLITRVCRPASRRRSSGSRPTVAMARHQEQQGRMSTLPQAPSPGSSRMRSIMNLMGCLPIQRHSSRRGRISRRLGSLAYLGP